MIFVPEHDTTAERQRIDQTPDHWTAGWYLFGLLCILAPAFAIVLSIATR